MPQAGLTFVARASHPALGDAVAEGNLSFDPHFLFFSSSSLAVQIPLNRLQIALVSEEGRVSFTDPEQPECEIYTLDQRVLGDANLRRTTHTRSQLRAIQSQGEVSRRLKVTAWFLLGFAVIGVGGYLLTGVMVRSLVNKIPAEWEQELGNQVLAELKQEEVFIQDSKLQARVDAAVAALIPALPRGGTPYQFHLVQSPFPNAFALPGGHVLINTGLLDLVDRPEELAAVVAHEVAHVTQKHGFRKIISAAGPYLVCRLFVRDGQGLLGVLGQGSELLVRQSFSQEFELEADDVGWDYLVKARIDPRVMPEMLKKLEAEERRFKSMSLGAFSSHPATAKRIARLESKWKQLKDKSAFETVGRPAAGP